MKSKTIGKVTVKSNRDFTMLTPDRESLYKAMKEEKHRFHKKLNRELQMLEKDYYEAKGMVKEVSRAIEEEKRRLEVVRGKIKSHMNKLQIPDQYKTRAMDKMMQGEKGRLRQLESMLYRYNDLLNNIKKKRHDLTKRLHDEHNQNINRIMDDYYKVLIETKRMQKKRKFNL